MNIKFIEYEGIKGYTRLMYNDVKDADKENCFVDVAYSGKDIKAVLEYLFSLEDKIDKAIELLENNYLYHYGSEKRPVVFEDNYIQELYDMKYKKEIIELNKEIERLNEECDTYMEVATRKARRIREAIEYIKENADDNCSLNFAEKLLNILKGGNNE